MQSLMPAHRRQRQGQANGAQPGLHNEFQASNSNIMSSGPEKLFFKNDSLTDADCSLKDHGAH